MKNITRLTENDLHRIVEGTVKRVLKEGWEDDRFQYDHLTDEGNGGLEEYGMNIAQLIYGMGTDQDALHALGEQTAIEVMSISGDGYKSGNAEQRLKPFIEGLIAVYKNPNNPYDTYKKYGIERN